MLNSTDVFVIGGGPAGLAAAIAARQRGFRVTVADGANMPIDKPCGEGLMPDGLVALQKLGVEISAENSYSFRGIRFLSGDLAVDAAFPHGASGRGVRRTMLHQLIAERAARLGIDFLWHTAVTGISADAVHLGDREIRTRWIIGADGGSSRVRRWAGLDDFRERNRRYAFRRHYQVAPWTDRMELHWDRLGQIYVTPISAEQVCVALISRDPKLRLNEALRGFPELEKRLAGAEAASTEKGAVTATCRLRRVRRGNVALIGDASGTVDAITGEGLCLAFSQAMVLAECLEDGDLGRYEREHRRLAFRPRLMARLMLLLDQRPRLQRRALRALGERQQLFQRLLELHVGILSPLHLAADGLTLGWGLLTA
ncbi:MAG TPA: NAD(P)/FAD-dependent oxidoreductase [Candidatus Dormibacteraeota bacterium]|nr:NAD(P)/FAD-dependent oxidoreductase [Candidatus Dormibacteraeota bacterium]